jgi:hypothetical protein
LNIKGKEKTNNNKKKKSFIVNSAKNYALKLANGNNTTINKKFELEGSNLE